jgi:hypothetical protein
VQRELLVRTRDKNTWRVRALAAGAAFLLGAPLLLLAGPASPLGWSGQEFFYVLTGLTFIFCLFEGARQTSDCISGERREGTLGLLFLTDLKGYDVATGKLAASSINSFFGLLAVFPVLSLAMLAGGITVGEFWRMALALSSTLALSLTAGLSVSARNVAERRAIVGTTLLLAGISGGLPLLDTLLGLDLAKRPIFSLGSPVYACYLASDAGYRAMPGSFWLAEATQLGLAIIFLTGADFATTRFVADEGESAKRSRARTKLDKRHRELLERNPVLWLAGRNRALVASIMALQGVSGLIYLVQLHRILSRPGGTGGVFVKETWFISIILWLVVAVLMAYCVCEFFSESRRNGMLELLFATPLRDSEIVDGYLRSLRRVFRGPILLGLLAWILAFIPGWMQTSGMAAGVVFDQTISHIIGLATVVTNTFALIYAGGWFALSSRSTAHAVTKTLAFVILLPAVISIIFIPLMSLWLGIPPYSSITSQSALLLFDLFFIKWAKHNFKVRFRETAVRRITGETLSRAKTVALEAEYFSLLSDPRPR